MRLHPLRMALALCLVGSPAVAEKTLWLARPLYPGQEALVERTERALAWGPLVSCGKVSYGMYIFHWPLVVLGVPYLTKLQE